MAGDSPEVEGLKLVARSHQAFIWDRTRHFQRLRSALREFFPAALEAFPDLMAPEALNCWSGRRIRPGRPGCHDRRSPLP